MPGIRIGETTGETEMISDAIVVDVRVDRPTKVAELSKRFSRWHAQNVSATNYIDSCDDRIKRCIRQTSVFANGKIVPRFVEAESKVKFEDMIESCAGEAELVIHQKRCGIEKDEVSFDEREGLIGPDTSVAGIGNASLARAFRFARSLAAFECSRTSEHA
jgi:hypothetical protein